MTTKADTVAQLIASALNIAADLLPLFDELRAVESDPEALKAKRDELTTQANGIADRLRAG